MAKITWPADAVERRKTSALKANKHNARTHPPEQIEFLRKAIRQFGWTFPILVDEKDIILAGHARLEAAILSGILEVPVLVARGWNETKKRAYIEADNKLSELSGYNAEKRRSELQWLSEQGFEMEAIGWAPDALGEFMAVGNVGKDDPDAEIEPPKKTIVRKGDLWLLGNHRLLCGDSTEEEDVDRLIGDEKCQLLISDPPYGVDYDPSWRADANKWKGSKVKIGAKAMGRVAHDTIADWRKAWKIFKGDVAYVWHGGLRCIEQAIGLEAAGFVVRSQIVWDKGRLVISRGDYHWQHECAWYAVRKGRPGHWNGSRTESTVWSIPKPQRSETGHGTQKPVECMKRPIENNSKAGQWVYDPFVGSGTTIIAAEMTGRRCLAVEIEPSYVEVCIERWQRFTEQEATLDGVPFSQVAAARRKGQPKGGTKNAARGAGIAVRGRNGPARANRAPSKPPVRPEVSPA